MAGVPGGQGLQQFGIGIFVAAGTIPNVTTPPYWGQSSGENVVRQERVVYSPTSTPVFVAPAATPSVLAEVAGNIVRAAVRSLAVFAATAAMAEPVYVPPAAVSASLPLAYAIRETQPVLRRVVYSPTATPVFKPPAVTPSALAYQHLDALWKQQRKILQDGVAVPLRALAATTPSAFAYQHVEAVWRAQRKDLPDGYAEPLRPAAAAATATPSFAPADAPQNLTLPRQTKPIPRSSYVFAYPVDDLADDYTGQFIRPKKKLLPEGYIQPPFQPPAVVVGPSIDSKLAGAYGSPVVILSRVVYDPVAARPAFPPAPPPTTPTPSTAPPPNSLTVVRTAIVVLNQPTTPVFPPAPPVVVGATTPSTVPPDAPLNSFRPSRIKPVQQSAFVFAYPIDDYAENYSAQFRRQPKVLPDGLAQPPFQPPAPAITPSIWFETYPALKAAPINRDAVKADLDGFQPRVLPLPAVTPSYLFETIAPPWKAKPNATAIGTDLNGFVWPSKLPPPPAITPANLFDNVGPVQRFLANAKAVGINLQGFAWSPQDPRNLTGGPQTIPPPRVISPYPSGGESYYWQRIHKKPAKSDRRCRFVTIDGVLTWICDRLPYEATAEARLQALDLVYDAEGMLEPLLEAVRLEEATNASAAKRAAAALLIRAIHEAVIEEEDDDFLLLE